MKRGYLSEYFDGVAMKRLSAVDAEPTRSNQHEVGTTPAMRDFLGQQKQEFPATFIWLGSEQESFSEAGTLTLYDSREKQDHRGPEWRLYYSGNAVTEAMQEGDTLFVAKRTDGSVFFIIAPQGGSMREQVSWLFGFEGEPELRFAAHQVAGNEDAELDFSARLVLDELGIEFEDPDANTIDAIIDRFGLKFPSTVEFSDLARLTLPQIRAEDDPDAALLAWLDHEEAMFRRLERRIVGERLKVGFVIERDADVDGFLKYSLQVQNRRKSRMGRALENHLAAVFRAFDLMFEAQAITERGNRADFLFPGSAEYHDETFLPERLTLLAAKSTCKDRWRQVLPEAQRIWPKHLATLEPAISSSQTEQMQAEQIQLVIPTTLQSSYRDDQRAWLMSVADFIAVVSDRERARGSA
jgi:hypothetical protein